MRLPDDFVLVRDGVAVRRGYEDELAGWLALADGAAPGGAAPLPASATSGRGAVHEVELARGGRAFVRRYVHGGLLRRLLRDVYWQRPPRPLRELAATEAARRAGIEAPEVLAAIVRPLGARRRGLAYRGVLVTRALAGRRSLGAALREARSEAERAAYLEQAVRAIRALHAAGIRHRDLNAGNLLAGATPDGGVAVIDFDRATLVGRPLGRRDAWLALRRLSRSLAKIGVAGLDRRAARRALRAAGLGRER